MQWFLVYILHHVESYLRLGTLTIANTTHTLATWISPCSGSAIYLVLISDPAVEARRSQPKIFSHFIVLLPNKILDIHFTPTSPRCPKMFRVMPCKFFSKFFCVVLACDWHRRRSLLSVVHSELALIVIAIVGTANLAIGPSSQAFQPKSPFSSSLLPSNSCQIFK